MNYFIKSRSDVSPLDWDAAVTTADEGYYFALSCWLDGIIEVKEWGLQDYSFVVYQDHKIIAIVPLHWNKKIDALLSSGWGWSGPICLKQTKKTYEFIFNHIEKLASSLKARSVRLGRNGVVDATLNSSKNINPWVLQGYKDTSSHTQILNLQNKTIDDLWLDLSQTARQMVKKAGANCTVELVNWKDHLDQYYQLHKFTYEKSNLTPHPFAYFQMISNRSPENHKLFVAYDKSQKPIAYHNDVHFKKTSWYHTAASSDEGHQQAVHYLLTWNAIKYAKDIGCTLYETGEVVYDETNKKTKQIAFFKTRFGGDLHRLYRAEKQFIYHPKKENFIHFIRSSKKLCFCLFKK